MDKQGVDRIGRAQALVASLGLGHYERIPAHLIFRMAALVGGDPSSSATCGSKGSARDAYPAFTATHVIYATVAGAQLDDEPPRGESTVDCHARSSGDLQTVGTDADDDDAWHNNWGSVIPTGSQLTLRYTDDVVVRLPLTLAEGRAARVDAFLPSLLADL